MSYNPSSSLSGEVRMFAGTSAPSGWLLCQGQAISRTVYADLFSLIGTTYGSGDGATTFNIPNTSGIFVRGAGSQTINDGTYTVTYNGVLPGNKQTDRLQGHKHILNKSTTNANVSWAAGSSTIRDQAGVTAFSSDEFVGNPKTDGANGTPRIGDQTQPANISFNYIIKV